jgi:hypothetical protein
MSRTSAAQRGGPLSAAEMVDAFLFLFLSLLSLPLSSEGGVWCLFLACALVQVRPLLRELSDRDLDHLSLLLTEICPLY